MARSLWTGSISFGLVNVPVALYSAVRDLDVHFRQLHEKDGAPIDTRRFCSEEDKEVPFEAVAHGYEEDGKKPVILSDEDLAAAAPRKTRTIDIEAFVDLEDVDPIYFDHPYFLAPVGDAEGNLRAYRLLVKVLASTDRAALGRFVLRSKEYLVLVRVREDRLALTTLLFHDEVRPTKGIDTGGRKPAKAQLDATVKLVEALATDWDPEAYEDRYRERLLEVIERKRKGRKITVPESSSDSARGPAAGHHGGAEGVARAGAVGGGLRPLGESDGSTATAPTRTGSRTSAATSSTSARSRRSCRAARR